MSDVQEPELRRMLDVDQVLAMIPVSRTTLFRMERDGKFPPSFYPSPNRRFWYADDVAAWQASLPSNGRIGKRVSPRART
jgi:predicted DNA-binding transcriptional regulator AlpA